jgi:hypothetical protein
MRRSNDCAAVVRYVSRNISLSALGVRSETMPKKNEKNARRTPEERLTGSCHAEKSASHPRFSAARR